jgi:MFS family permease
MDRWKEIPREAQITLGCLVLFVIISFLDWQQASIGPYTVGRSLWHGVGIITIIIALAYLVWEIGRAANYAVNIGQITAPTTSAGFAIGLLVFTVITFLDWSDYRHWPAWIGLLLSIVIAVVAFKRAKDEGVEIPKMPESVSVTRGGGAAAAAAPPPAAEPAPPAAEPAPPAAEPAPPASEPAPPAAEGGSEEAPHA